MFRFVSLIGLFIMLISISTFAVESKKEKTWWEKREDRQDIYYPHEAHFDVMKEEGDSCLLCHPFVKNELKQNKLRKQLNIISNEPLKAICHDCHVKELRAPWRCTLCHPDAKTIWPQSHNFGYIEHHREDAKHSEESCGECHLDRQFCTDCHFKRDTAGQGYHPLGYRNIHGIDARMMPANCGECHNNFYCQDCHRTQ